MISLTVREAVNFVPALQRVMELKLPVKASYRLSRIAAKLQPELTTFETARQGLVKDYGTEVADKPGTFQVEGIERQKELLAKMEELLDETLSVDLDPVTLDMLGNSEIAGADLYLLSKVIV